MFYDVILPWDNIIKDLSPDVDHIVPCNGALIYSIQSAYTGKGETGFTIIVNGEQYIFGQGYSGTDYPHPTNGFLQLKKGDVINISVSVGQKIHFVKYIGNGSLYFYVGEVAQNTNLVNAGRIEEKIAGLIPDNSSLISGYGMPSNKYVDLTLGASGTFYTAPANGYFTLSVAQKSSGAGFWMYGAGDLCTFGQDQGASNTQMRAFIPCCKGQQITIDTSGTLTVNHFRFIYAEGEV